MAISQDKYVDHGELTDYLQSLQKAFPGYASLEEAGRSLENREIWAVTITDRSSGRPENKPALYLDACIHAGEITGTQVCLAFMDALLDGAGKDPVIDRLLATRTFYVLPRTNPDGAERFIHTEFESWGNLRPFLLDPETDGLERCDIDGNKLLLLMRKKDPNGEWKISEKDGRLMIPREPYEYDGAYYSIYPEGLLKGEEVTADDFKVLPRKYQLNMNRNYPDGWNIQTAISEGGEYPLSEPETRAVALFIMAHRNIGMIQDLHTNAGVILRPYSYQDDSHIPALDMEIMRQFGEMAKKETGYDTVGVFEAFATPNEPPRRGCLDDWTYDSLGMLSLCTELWNLAEKVGIGHEEGNYYPDQLKTEEEELMMLRWNDEQLGGKNFINWTAFDHPQLGPVELGGWNWKYTVKNPPVQYLAEECRKVTAMLLKQANFLPELMVKSAKTEKLAEGLYKLSLTVENAGFLPSFIVAKALENKVAPTVTATLSADGGFTPVKGKTVQSLGHLAGRIRMDRAFYFGDPTEGVPQKAATVSWVVRAEEGTRFTVRIASEKAGTLTYTLPSAKEA